MSPRIHFYRTGWFHLFTLQHGLVLRFSAKTLSVENQDREYRNLSESEQEQKMLLPHLYLTALVVPPVYSIEVLFNPLDLRAFFVLIEEFFKV